MSTSRTLPRRLAATTLAAATLATGLAVSAAPAHADGPTREVVTEDFVRHLPELCDFPVSIHVWGSFNILTFTDEAGNLTKEIRNFRFRSVTSANGIEIHGSTMGPEILTVDADGSQTLQIMGVVNRRIPGEGNLVLHSGLELVLIDGEVEVHVQSAGQRNDVSGICQYLTP